MTDPAHPSRGPRPIYREVDVRRKENGALREYLLLLERARVNTTIERQGLEMLEAELARWENIHRRSLALLAARTLASMVEDQPGYETVPVGESGHFCVRVAWPDGTQTEVHGFRSDVEADTWIEANGARWREWAPQRMPKDVP
jgi:hypothetical protein